MSHPTLIRSESHSSNPTGLGTGVKRVLDNSYPQSETSSLSQSMASTSGSSMSQSMASTSGSSMSQSMASTSRSALSEMSGFTGLSSVSKRPRLTSDWEDMEIDPELAHDSLLESLQEFCEAENQVTHLNNWKYRDSNVTITLCGQPTGIENTSDERDLFQQMGMPESSFIEKLPFNDDQIKQYRELRSTGSITAHYSTVKGLCDYTRAAITIYQNGAR